MNKEQTIDVVAPGKGQSRFEWCYAIPGQPNVIDMIHPASGLTLYGGRTAEEIAEEYPEVELMKYEDFLEEKDKIQTTKIYWEEIGEDRFDDALNALPPIEFDGNAFLLGEPFDHRAKTGEPRYDGFVNVRGKYFVTSRAVTRKEFQKALKDA